MNQLGVAAEQAAHDFLLRQGLRCLARNWQCRVGELDLVMQDGATVVFVEVRARASARFGGAAASLTPAKCRKLELAASHYLQQYRHLPPCRFDAVLFQGADQPLWLKNILG